MVLAVVAMGVGAGTAIVQNVQVAAMNTKLSEDVDQLNTAIKVYLTGGGSLQGVSDPQAVVDKLKTVVNTSDGNDREIMFLKRSMIDPRLEVVTNTANRGGFWKWGRRYASYDANLNRFRVLDSLSDGAFYGFALDSSRGLGDLAREQRHMTFRQAKDAPWVWDYDPRSTAAVSQPPRSLTGMDTNGNNGAPSATGGATQALPPHFSPLPPQRTLNNYPLTVTLENPNNPLFSRILYHLEPGAGIDGVYSGPIAIDPAVKVVAYVQSLDQTVYFDSQTENHTYTPDAVPLVLTDTLQAGFTYPELGGAMADGSPNLTPMTPGKIRLSNEDQIPNLYENDTSFRAFWTYDGTDPRTSTTTTPGISFFNGYQGDPVPVSLPHFGNGNTLQIQYYAKSFNPIIVQDSVPVVRDLVGNKLTLPPPLLSLPPGGPGNTGPFMISPDVGSGIIPKDYRIFYRLDGMDPGNANGEPAVGAMEYIAPLAGVPPGGVIAARVYAPIAHKHWFHPSPVAILETANQLANLYYAVGGNSKIIYIFDAANGNNAVKTSSALFPIECIAVNSINTAVYYVEKAAGSWRLGRYDVTNGSHNDLGKLSEDWFFEKPVSQPTNLMFFNDGLYYLHENSDNLVKIELTGDGTSIAQQFRVADLTQDAVAFTSIGDIAADGNGKMFISASNVIATYDLRKMGEYTVLREDPSVIWNGFVFGDGSLFGVSNVEPDKVYLVDQSTGSGLASADFNPVRQFWDFAGAQPPVPTEPIGGQHYFVTNGYSSIYRLDLATGRNYLVTTLLPMQPTGIAIDRVNSYIYTVGYDDSDRPGDVFLCRYDLTAGTSKDLGSLKSNAFPYQPATYPLCLTYFESDLYYITPDTDDLIRLTVGATSVSGQTHVADLIGSSASLGEVDALTIGPDGWLYLSRSDADLFAKYDIGNLTGFSIVKDSYEASFQSLTYDVYGQLHGSLASKPTQVFTVDELDGTSLFKFDTQPSVSMWDITGMFDTRPQPVTKDYFACDGLSARIFRFDPETGQNQLLTSASWTVDNVAFDADTRRVFYMRKGSMELGVYTLQNGQHDILGQIDAPSLHYRPAQRPDNLTCFNGALYYVAPFTDDLVKIDISPGGWLGQAYKVTDLSTNTLDFGGVGDLSVDANGILYFTSSAAFASFDMRTSANLTVLTPSPSSDYAGLLHTSGGLLIGTATNNSHLLHTVDAANGKSVGSIPNIPLRPFTDIAGPQNRVPVDVPPGTHYFVESNSSVIRELDLATGVNRIITWGAPWNIGGITYDPEAKTLYYSENRGSPTQTHLAKYEVALDRHTELGSIISPELGYTPPAMPNHLTLFLGDLYYVAPDTDDLIKLTITDSAVVASEKMADINADVSLGDVGSVTVDNTGWLYLAKQSGNLLAKYNLYTLNGYLPLNSGTSANYQGLTFDAANNLFGFPSADAGNIYSVDKIAGTSSLARSTNPVENIWDITGNNASPPPEIPGNSYAVGGGNRRIYKFDPVTGVNGAITTTAPFNLRTLARDPVNNVFYYFEDVPSGWRLGRFEAATATHTILGDLTAPGFQYLASTRPTNLFFYGGALFYIANNSDDLVMIQTDGLGITAQVKVADITGNSVIFPEVGDVAVDATGNAYATANSPRFFRFNMKTLGGYTQVTTSLPHYFALLFTDEGQFFGTNANADTQIYSINKSNGTHAYSALTRPTRNFWDMAGHEISAPWSKSDSLWAIIEHPPDDPAALGTLKARLVEFKNYRTPLIVTQDWGLISLAAGSNLTPFNGPSQISSLTITSSGTGYLVRNAETIIDGVTYQRPLFKIEVGSQAAGQAPLAHFVGDLSAALVSLGAGPTDPVTGLAAGMNGVLHGVVAQGDAAAPDRLFTISNLLRDSDGQLINVFSPGNIEGSGAAATSVEDLSFSSNGTLYIADNADRQVYLVDPATAAITATFSTEATGSYRGIAVNPADNDVTASDTSTNRIMRILADAGNDTGYFSYFDRFSMSDIRAIAFFNGSFSPTQSAPPYFAVDRTQRIYAIDPATGATTLVTARAPFPLDAIAYDRVGGVIYYVENAAANFRLGSYTLSSNTHAVLGNLASGSYAYNPAEHPRHLVFYSGDLYYINANTDDLVRIKVSAGAIISQEKASDINRDNSISVVQGAALNDAGMLYFTNANVLMKYNLRTLSGYTAIAPSFGSYESLLWNSSSGTLHGAASAALTRIDTIGTATGYVAPGVVTSPPISLYDMSGPNSAVPSSSFDTSVFAVTGGNKSIYVVNPSTGQNSLLDSGAPFNVSALAYDADNALLYYLEDTADTNNLRLGRLAVNSSVHTVIGNIKAGSLGYRPAERPRNLAFFNGDLYYIPRNSDDLVKIAIVGTTISAQTKVVDLRSNSPFVDVGDLAVTPGGLLFFSDNAATRPLYRYDLASLSGLQQFGTTSRYFDALTWFDSKLYAAGGSTAVDALNYHDGLVALGTVTTSPARAFVDFASAVSGSVNGRSSSIWAIAERGLTGNLVDFRNYRSAQLVDSLDYGEIYHMDGATQVSLTASGPKIRAMVVSNTGRLFFVNDERVTIAGQVYQRALFHIDLPSIEVGRPVLATFVGDLEQGLVGIGSNDRVTSLGIGPDGALYGSYRTDSTTAEDFLFRLTSLRLDGNKSLIDVRVINRFSGAGHNVTVVEDLAFGPDGTLYVSDAFTNEIMVVDPTSAAITGLFSHQAGIAYLALSMDPADNAMIGSYVSGTGQSGEKVMQLVTPGSTPDQKLFDYGNKFNYGRIESMSFYTRPFVAGEGALYAIGGGDKKIYTVNSATGSVSLVDADSPAPSGAIQTLAYNAPTHTVYYTDAPDAGGHFRLFAYSLVNDAHTLLGQLDGGSYAYSITQGPSNLTAINGDLFFVHKETDDLVRIRFSANAITAVDKMADLSGDTLVLGEVGDLTVRDDGMLFMASNTALYRYNLPALSGFQQVAPTATDWKAISFSNGNLVGNRTSIPTSIYLIDADNATGVLASTTAPALEIADLASSEPAVELPTAPAAPYFGVNGSKTIFTVDPETSSTTVLTTGALFNTAALACDAANNILYYVEASDVDFRLGRFDISSGQHTTLGNMEVGTFSYNPSQHPHHLACYNGDLYYINRDSDDLVRMKVSGAAILAQDKVADLNGDLSLETVSAATVDNEGTLYYSNATALMKYDLRSGGTASVINSSFASYVGLLWYPTSATLYATAAASPARMDQVTTDGGSITEGSNTVPSVSFIDLASGNNALAPDPAQYFGVNRTTRIYQINPVTGANSMLPTATAYSLDSIAYHAQRGLLYVVENTNTNTRLGRYDLASNTFTSLGNLRASNWSYVPTERPQHLFCYDDSLYYINYDATVTAKRDDLVRVRVSDTAILAQEKVGDIAADAGLSRVTAAAVDDGGWMYFNSGSLLKKYDLRNLNGLADVNTSTAIYSGLLWYGTDNFLYGTNSNSNRTRNELTRISVVNGAATFQANVSPSISGGFYDLAGGNNAQPPPSLDVPKAYIGGDFADASGNFHNLARLNNDGTLDTTFNTGIGTDGPVRTLCRLNSGQILAGGEFGFYKGVARYGLVAVNGDGSLNSSFNPAILSSGITTEVPLDWANWTSFAQNMGVNGTDPWFAARDAYYGLASATGGVAGFGSQTWNNVSGSGVNMTVYVSQNMTEANEQLQGPDLHGDTTAYTGGANPDRRITGHTALRFTSDQNGSTIAPATIVVSFSEPVYINQAVWGNLSSLGGLNNTPAINLLDNGSFEAGPGWTSGPNWFPNSAHPNKVSVPEEVVSSGVIESWDSTRLTWVEDVSRAAEGNRFVYLSASQGSEFRVRQDLTVGSSPGPGIDLVSGKSYRVSFNCAPFHPYLANGDPDYTVTPQFQFQYQSATGQTINGQMALIDSATSVTVSPSAAQNWDDLQWKTVTGTFTAPSVDASTPNLTVWVSLLKGSADNIATGTNHMANYNVICFEDLNAADDIDGKTWVGRNITSTAWFQMGDLYTPLPNDNVVVVCGTVGGSSTGPGINFAGGSNAKLVVKDSASRGARPINWIGGGSQATRLKIDASIVATNATMRADLEQRAMAYRDLPSNSSVIIPAGQPDVRIFRCSPQTVNGQGSVAVFNVNAADIFGSGSLSQVEIDSATGNAADVKGAIINVSGANVNWTSGFSFGSNFATNPWRQKVIWNFHQAATFEAGSHQINGSVLAPFAAVTSSNHFDGSLVCKSLVTTGECHRVPFVSGEVVNAVGQSAGLLIDNVNLVESPTYDGSRFENAYFRAFATPDASGAPIAASNYANLSDRTVPLLGNASDPVTTADLNNVRMDSNPNDGVYHTIGVGAQEDGRYGRVSFSYLDQPVRSIALTIWTTEQTEAMGAVNVPSFDAPLTSGSAAATFTLVGLTRSTPPLGKVYAMLEQPDEKIVIGGDFGQIHGAASKNVARLNPDGSLDSSFNPGSGPNGPVYALALLPDGSLAVGGSFSTWNGQPSGNRLVLLSSAGARDTTFNAGISNGPSDVVNWLDIDASGKILAAGKFSSPRNGIARLNSNGSNDATFDPGSGVGTSTVNDAVQVPGGGLIVGGDFTSVNGVSRNRMARIMPTGAVESSWNPGTGFDNAVQSVALLSGSSFVHVGGSFSSFQGNVRNKAGVVKVADANPGVTPWGPSSLTINRVWAVR